MRICLGERALLDKKLDISVNTCDDVCKVGVLGSHSGANSERGLRERRLRLHAVAAMPTKLLRSHSVTDLAIWNLLCRARPR